MSVRCVQNKYKGKGFVAQKHDCVLRSVIDVTTKRLQNFIKKQQLELAAHVHITYNEETHRLARTNPCSEEWQKLSDRSPGLLAIPCTVEILQTPIRHDVCVFVSSDKVPVVCATIAFSQHRAIAPPSFQHTQTHTHTHTHTKIYYFDFDPDPRFDAKMHNIFRRNFRGRHLICIVSIAHLFPALGTKNMPVLRIQQGTCHTQIHHCDLIGTHVRRIPRRLLLRRVLLVLPRVLVSTAFH